MIAALMRRAMAIWFYLLAIYLFFTYSRILVIFAPGIRLSLVLFGLLVLATVFSGGFRRGWATRTGAYLCGFSVLIVVGLPFSLWRGGSVSFVLEHWLRSFLIFFIVIAFATSWRRVYALLTTSALAISVLTVLAVMAGQVNSEGRLIAPGFRFANPNDFGYVLVLGMLLWGMIISDRKRSLILRAAGVGSVPLMMLAVLKTASRGATVALAVATFVLFLHLKMRAKVVLAAGAAAAVLLGAVVLPPDLRARLFTYKESNEEYRVTGAAAGSTFARLYLLGRSVDVALDHPIFGAGIGMFLVADDIASVEEGQRKGSWHEAHNIYAQVASECGIPAFILFVLLLWEIWKITGAIARLRPHEHPLAPSLSAAGVWLRAFWAGVLVCGLAGNFAYDDFIPVFGALIVALHSSVEQESRSYAAAEINKSERSAQERGAWDAAAAPAATRL